MQQTMFDELVHGLLSILAEQTVQIVLYGSTAEERLNRNPILILPSF